MKTTMKALVLRAFNQNLVPEEIARPVPGKGEVLVKIAASSINPLDLKIKNGQASHAQIQLPAILGIDMAGTVEAVGEDIDSFRVGDEVYGMVGGVGNNQGTLAEYIAADASLLALKPHNLSFREAAALPLVLITAWEGLVDKANIRSGQDVLIHGGAGGVGHIALQLAKANGANVFATVSAQNEELVRSYGATPINYSQVSVEEYVQLYTSGRGFDLVFDTVGGSTLDASFKAAKRYTGHVVSILGWSTHSLAPLSFRSATYSGVFTLYPLLSGEGRSRQGQILAEATPLIESGAIRPRMHNETFSLATIADAYKAAASGKTQGKVIVSIDETT